MTYESRGKRNGSGLVTTPIVIVRSRKAKLKDRRAPIKNDLSGGEKEWISPTKASKSERD